MPASVIQFINHLTKQLTDKGFENVKNEIIWYLEFLELCNRTQIYSDTLLINPAIQQALDIFYSKRIKGMPLQYIIESGNFYGRDFFIKVKSDDIIHDSILNNSEEDIPGSQIGVFFGGDMIEPRDTFGDHDIDNGARLEISTKKRATFEDVVRDVIELNPGLVLQA